MIKCKRCDSPELWREGIIHMNNKHSTHYIEFNYDDGGVICKSYQRVYCADCNTEFYLHPDKGMIEQ